MFEVVKNDFITKFFHDNNVINAANNAVFFHIQSH